MLFWVLSDLIFIGIPAISILIEPRRMRNAVYSAMALLWIFLSLAGLVSGSILAPLNAFVILIPGLYIVLAFFLIFNGVTVIRIEGKCKTTMATLFAGIAMLVIAVVGIILLSDSQRLGKPGAALLVFIVLSTLYVMASLFCFLLYSLLYSLLPKKPDCDYIIIHGAGLRADGTPTPLLKLRIEKAITLYHKCGGRPLLIPSGGQGSDEPISEAESMKRYMLLNGIPESSIIKEDRSTTTYENLYNVKQILDARENGRHYKCIFVTNNYHVLRTAFYSKKLEMDAQGVGCRTAKYYLPSAFIREYVAVMTRIKVINILYLAFEALMISIAVHY